MTLVRAQDIALRRSGTQILNGISLAIQPGECIGLLGPSGCGKSSLVRVLLGMMSPNKGQISYCPALRDSAPSMGYVPQDDIIHRSLTVEQVFRYALKLRTGPDADPQQQDKKIQQLLRVLDLSERAKTRVKHLSGGQRKRVNLGTELLTDPMLLFLDEPTAGLDPHLEREMMKLFQKLATPERAVLVTTHRLANVTLFDAVFFLYEGTLVFAGAPEDALAFFQVDDYERIFSKVRLLPAPKIAERFKASPFYAGFQARLRSPLASKAAHAQTPLPQPTDPKAPAQKAPQPAPSTPASSPGPASSSGPASSPDPASSIDSELERLKAQLAQKEK